MMNNHPGFGPAGMTGFPMMQQPGMMGPQGPMMQQQMMMANRGPMMQGNMFPMQVCICINGFDSLKIMYLHYLFIILSLLNSCT